MRSIPLLFVLALSQAHGAGRYQIDANIRYARHAETLLDVIQPEAPALKNRPAVIAIHGDDWIHGAKEDIAVNFCGPFLDKGFVVVNVDYRLAEASPAPAAFEDILKAVTWLQEHAAQYKVDTSKIVMMGVSAGGHLALLTAFAPESAGFGPTPSIAAVVNFEGIADVTNFPTSWLIPTRDRSELAHKLSPVTWVRKGVPPVLTIHGDQDTVVPYAQSERLTKDLKSAGADTDLITIHGGGHTLTKEQLAGVWPQVFKWLKKRKIEA